MPGRRRPPYNAAAAARYLAELQLPLWTDDDLRRWADERERQDRADSDAARDSGMAATLGKNAEWTDAAYLVLLRLAFAGDPFTSESVTEAVGLPAGQQAMHKNNAVGALFAAAAREGLIRKTGRIVNAKNGPSHSHMINEWIGTIER